MGSSRAQHVLRPLDFYRMPNEMWIAVFEALVRPSDLLKVISTCKYFYALAIRVLCREIYWMGPFIYADNARFWDRQEPSMAEIPTSLTVAVSLMTPNAFGRFDPGTALVDPDGSWRFASNVAPAVAPHPFTPLCATNAARLNFYASVSMYDSITHRISTFAMLKELIFHMAELPDTIYTTIKGLIQLRNLSIRYCTLPVVYSEPDLTLSELPITELTLWSNKGDSDAVPNSSYVYALYLCTAKHLRTLRIDWNGVTARFLSLRNPDAPPITLPTNVADLTLRFPLTKVWPTQEEDDHTTNMHSPYNPLSRFLAALPNIKTFTVVNRRTSLELTNTAMPHLNTFIGPMITAASILQNRPIDHLEVTDIDKRAGDHLFSLPLIAGMRPNIQTLSLIIKEWDDEILFALSSLFQDLRMIRIRYNIGFPSEQTLVSLGAQFLYRFPNLQTLHLYQSAPPAVQPGSGPRAPAAGPSTAPRPRPARGKTSYRGPGAGEDDDEVRELIAPWRKHCRWLREVRFVEGYVWRRAFDGDLWCKRDIETGLDVGQGWKEWEV